MARRTPDAELRQPWAIPLVGRPACSLWVGKIGEDSVAGRAARALVQVFLSEAKSYVYQTLSCALLDVP